MQTMHLSCPHKLWPCHA